MDEDVKPKISGRLPKWAQAFIIERLPLKLRRNDHPGEAEFDGAALQLKRCLLRIQRRDMRKTNEATGIIAFRLVHAVVNQAAGGKVWLIETRAAGEHRNVDARPIHHPHMRGKVGELSIETIIWISIFV